MGKSVLVLPLLLSCVAFQTVHSAHIRQPGGHPESPFPPSLPPDPDPNSEEQRFIGLGLLQNLLGGLGGGGRRYDAGCRIGGDGKDCCLNDHKHGKHGKGKGGKMGRMYEEGLDQYQYGEQPDKHQRILGLLLPLLDMVGSGGGGGGGERRRSKIGHSHLGLGEPGHKGKGGKHGKGKGGKHGKGKGGKQGKGGHGGKGGDHLKMQGKGEILQDIYAHLGGGGERSSADGDMDERGLLSKLFHLSHGHITRKRLLGLLPLLGGFGRLGGLGGLGGFRRSGGGDEKRTFGLLQGLLGGLG